MNKEYALKRLKDAGYKITHLGKNIRAEKTSKAGDKENHVGRVFNVIQTSIWILKIVL